MNILGFDFSDDFGKSLFPDTIAALGMVNHKGTVVFKLDTKHKTGAVLDQLTQIADDYGYISVLQFSGYVVITDLQQYTVPSLVATKRR